MPILVLENVTKSFQAPDGTVRRVLDVDHFTLDQGAQLALRGTSGTGKTTLLHTIAGILTPDTGKVHVNGKDMAAMSEAKRDRHRAESIGYVFQTFNLLQGFSALENVMLAQSFGIGANQNNAMALLERVGLSDRMRHLPGQLSTGQQQRVAVARALANSPRLLLADEPTGNLDPDNSAQVLALIRTIARESGAALLLVSHDQDVLRDFEQVQDFTTLGKSAQAKP